MSDRMSDACDRCGYYSCNCRQMLAKMSMHYITHGYTDGHQVTACMRHNLTEVPSFSPRGASYAGVKHGAHADDLCDLCSR